MADEVQRLRDLVSQLEADNEQLQRERAASRDVPGGAVAGPSGSASYAPSSAATVTERLVVVPRDRKCPLFNGKTGLGIAEWTEEIEACMRVRRLSAADKALFIFAHLDGEAREEIRFRPSTERGDPAKIFAILRELYGCAQSYVTLQQAFFSRRQQEGETLQEYSLGLLALMEQVERCAPDGIPNAGDLLRDPFVEHVLDSSLRRTLKQYVRSKPTASLLDVRAEAIRWEREGQSSGFRGRSHSLPSAYGLQYGVQSDSHPRHPVAPPRSEMSDLMELLKRQQAQLDQLTQTVAALQAPRPPGNFFRNGPLICRRCQQLGHIARECRGPTVPPRARANSFGGANPQVTRATSSAHQPEN